MRFQVAVRRTQDGAGWEVTVTHVVPGPGGDTRVAPDRRLRRLPADVAQRGGFPLPPEEDVGAISPDAPHHRLCTATDVQALRDELADLATRDVDKGSTIPAFGAYLFAVLLGPTTWRSIVERAHDKRIELALRWAVTESELNRLPWEMMLAPEGYLVRARDPEVAITRIVAPEAPAVGASWTEDGRETLKPLIAPRVLFVVGTDIGDPSIRWGTEYLGMLRHLEREELGLLSKLVLRASPDDVRRAIAVFRPSVVHFICHGRVDGVDSAKIVMRSDEDPDREEEQELTAEQLGELIVGSDPAPPVVVLNACHTGGQPPSQVSAPMSVELVRQGIPVVIGMWGRVADRVCRLFTRRFYEALLDGRPIVSATAQGRREGFDRGPDPDKSADWCFPSVFLSHRVHPELATDADALAAAKRTDRIARDFRVLNDPPVFCDRFEIFEAAKHVLTPGDERAVLVVRELDTPTDDHKYGKTRLLAELAVQGIREDLAPCLVVPRRLDDLPQSAADLADLILRFLIETRDRLQLEHTGGYVIEALESGAQDQIPEDVQKAVKLYGTPRDDPGATPPRALALAISHDLERLGADAGKDVLLLLDEVHRFGPGALDLLAYDLLEQRVLVTGDHVIPIVLALGHEPSYAVEFKRLEDTLRQRPKARELTVELKPFPEPDEDPLPYLQYLMLGGRSRYVIDDIPDYAPAFFAQLWAHTQGVPSRLTSDDVQALVNAWAGTPLLQEATDEEELVLRETGRP